MPIKVSDFIQNIAAYPVLRVEDNTILGYAYSAGSTQADLEAVPTTNRKAGLVLHGRALFHYDLANVTNAYWGDVTKHKEIATRFSSYPDVPFDVDTSVAEYLADPDNDGDLFFAIHNNANNTFYKLSHNDVVAWLVNALIQAQISSGAGTIENYSSPTGLLGDLNNDGTVSTQDLLLFLTAYGSNLNTGVYSDTIFTIATTSSEQLLNASGGGSTYTANTKKFFSFTSNNVSVVAGALDGQLNTAVTPNYISIKDNASSGYSINQFIANISYKITGIIFYINASFSGFQFQFGVRITKLLDNTIIGNSADVNLGLSNGVNSTGAIEINLYDTLYNINNSINSMTNPFGTGNGYLNDLLPGATGYDELRFSFYVYVPVDNAGIQSISCTLKLIADPTP